MIHFAGDPRVWRVAALVGAPLVALILVWCLVPRDYVTGTNSVNTYTYVAPTPAGQPLCVPDLEIPAGTARIELSLISRTQTRPPLELSLVVGDRTVRSSLPSRPVGADRISTAVFPIPETASSPGAQPGRCACGPPDLVNWGGTPVVEAGDAVPTLGRKVDRHGAGRRALPPPGRVQAELSRPARRDPPPGVAVPARVPRGVALRGDPLPRPPRNRRRGDSRHRARGGRRDPPFRPLGLRDLRGQRDLLGADHPGLPGSRRGRPLRLCILDRRAWPLAGQVARSAHALVERRGAGHPGHALPSRPPGPGHAAAVVGGRRRRATNAPSPPSTRAATTAAGTRRRAPTARSTTWPSPRPTSSRRRLGLHPAHARPDRLGADRCPDRPLHLPDVRRVRPGSPLARGPRGAPRVVPADVRLHLRRGQQRRRRQRRSGPARAPAPPPGAPRTHLADGAPDRGRARPPPVREGDGLLPLPGRRPGRPRRPGPPPPAGGRPALGAPRRRRRRDPGCCGRASRRSSTRASTRRPAGGRRRRLRPSTSCRGTSPTSGRCSSPGSRS